MRQGDSVSHYSARRPGARARSDVTVARWIQRTLKAEPPRARSLIVTVWGDALAPHGGTIWLAGLIRLMSAFGINERLVRTSVYRLARDGWLVAATHGRVSRYRLTREGKRRFDAAHQRIYARPDDDWSGGWDVVMADAVPPAKRTALREELVWAGFGALGPTVFVRPAQSSRTLPGALDAPGVAEHLLIAKAFDLPGRRPLTAAVAKAWDLSLLAAHYRRFLQRFGAVIERFRATRDGAHDPQHCFVVRTMLIHAYRRVLLRDPLLPAALLPLDWPGAAAYALCRDFYSLTHRCAERHLAATLANPHEDFPPADATFYERFGGLEDRG
jgi:phenylacetic acid degradation operon negative regulatory protein